MTDSRGRKTGSGFLKSFGHWKAASQRDFRKIKMEMQVVSKLLGWG
jgi:hypothetical protein